MFWWVIKNTQFSETLFGGSQNGLKNNSFPAFEQKLMDFGWFFVWITWILPKSCQLQMAVTLRLLDRFQSSWYLECLIWAETFENGIYNSILQVLPTLRVPNAKRISEKTPNLAAWSTCTTPLIRPEPGDEFRGTLLFFAHGAGVFGESQNTLPVV